VNHQTASDFQVWAEDIFIDGRNNIFPIFRGSGGLFLSRGRLAARLARLFADLPADPTQEPRGAEEPPVYG
jgi:hypothetical protein